MKVKGRSEELNTMAKKKKWKCLGAINLGLVSSHLASTDIPDKKLSSLSISKCNESECLTHDQVVIVWLKFLCHLPT